MTLMGQSQVHHFKDETNLLPREVNGLHFIDWLVMNEAVTNQRAHKLNVNQRLEPIHWFSFPLVDAVTLAGHSARLPHCLTDRGQLDL